MYQRKVDVDMLNAVKSVLADVSSVGPSSEESFCKPLLRGEGEWGTLQHFGWECAARFSKH